MKRNLRMPVLLIAAGLVALGCGEMSRSSNEASRQAAEYAASGNGWAADLGLQCRTTGGVWEPLLASCVCPLGKLFDPAAGCSRVEPSASLEPCRGRFADVSAETRTACLESMAANAQLSVDPQGLSWQRKERLWQELSADWLLPFRGEALSRGMNGGLLAVTAAAPTEAHLGFNWQPDLAGAMPEQAYFRQSNLAARRVELSRFSEQCRRQSRHVFQDGGGEAACELMAGVLGAVGAARGDSTGARSSLRKRLVNAQGHLSFGEHCRPNCFVKAEVTRAQLRATVTAKLFHYRPAVRRISVREGRRRWLAYVTPDARLEGVILEDVSFATGGSSLVVRNRVAFDQSWNRLYTKDERAGDRARWNRAFSSSSQERELFPHENEEDVIEWEVRGVVIDDGLDLRSPGLRQRIILGRPATDNQITGHVRLARSFEEPIVGPRRDPLSHVLDVFSSRARVKTARHGTEMASLMVRNLPGARLGFLKADELSHAADRREVIRRWRDYLKSVRPHVVNLSQSFDLDRETCKKTFAPLFRSLPDTLFVAAAGNTGSRDPDICPAVLSGEFANVLGVAGAASVERLHESSSFGPDVAQVAAPYGAECLKVVSGAEGLELARTECKGTSVAAATVSGLAMKKVASGFVGSARELAENLRRWCRGSIEEVSCGGAVGFNNWGDSQ